MIATVTIDGVLIEVSGTPDEAFKFIRLVTCDERIRKLADKMAETQEIASTPRWAVKANERFNQQFAKEPCCHLSACGVACMCEFRVCDPFSLHAGGKNCGASDCPIRKR